MSGSAGEGNTGGYRMAARKKLPEAAGLADNSSEGNISMESKGGRPCVPTPPQLNAGHRVRLGAGLSRAPESDMGFCVPRQAFGYRNTWLNKQCRDVLSVCWRRMQQMQGICLSPTQLMGSSQKLSNLTEPGQTLRESEWLQMFGLGAAGSLPGRGPRCRPGLSPAVSACLPGSWSL